MKRKCIDEIKKDILERTNGEYEILSTEYINNKEKLLFKHNQCGSTFSMSLDKFLNRGHRCPNCSKMRKKSFIEMREIITQKRPGIYLLSNYTASTKPALFYHIECERCFTATPTEILNGKKCPYCYDKTSGESERFQNKLNKKFKNSILLLDRYQNPKKKMPFYCNHCHTNFLIKPEKLLEYNECPICADEKPKQEIKEFLKIAEIPFRENETIFSGYIMKFDFFIPEMNLAIDYNGHFYYDDLKNVSSSNKERYKEKLKKQYCIDNKIKYLPIPFWVNNISEILYNLFLNIDEKSSLYHFNMFKRHLSLGSYKKYKINKQ